MSLIITEGLGIEGGGGAFAILSVVPGIGQLSVNLSATGVLTGDSLIPSKWVVTGGGTPVAVVAVAIFGTLITLTTTEQTDGASYMLLVPQGIVDFTTSNPCIGPFTWAFTGVGSLPTLAFARAIDARLLEVIFSKAVVNSEAVDPANYMITGGGGLTVSAGSKVTDTTYRLVTSRQDPGQLYTVTASNIHDLFGNLI
jgi:hypothetical protein